MSHWIGAHGRVKVAKKTQKHPYCDVPPEMPKSKTKKKFFDLNY